MLWEVQFEHVFERGILVGLVVPGKVTYPNLSGCLDWREGVNANFQRGKLDYRVRNVTLRRISKASHLASYGF